MMAIKNLYILYSNISITKDNNSSVFNWIVFHFILPSGNILVKRNSKTNAKFKLVILNRIRNNLLNEEYNRTIQSISVKMRTATDWLMVSPIILLLLPMP